MHGVLLDGNSYWSSGSANNPTKYSGALEIINNSHIPEAAGPNTILAPKALTTIDMPNP